MIRKLLVTIFCIAVMYLLAFCVTVFDIKDSAMFLFVLFFGIVFIASWGVRLCESKPKPRHATKNVIFDFEGNK